MYGSAADMSKLGRAILNSTLLKPSLTRRWLKPVSFTSDFVAAVGIPWGLRRLRLPGDNPHRTVTAFTKAGGVGDYSAFLSLLPEWNIGITVMAAGSNTGGYGFTLADSFGAIMLPAFVAAAREEALAVYGGTYSVADSSTLNSSLTVTADPNRPGLGLGYWVSNSTNMLPVSLVLQSGQLDAITKNSSIPSVRLYYSGLETIKPNGNIEQSWKAVFEDISFPSNQGYGFSTDCGNWITYTGVTYTGLPLDTFIFEMTPDRKVVSVRNLALMSTLKKVS